MDARGCERLDNGVTEMGKAIASVCRRPALEPIDCGWPSSAELRGISFDAVDRLWSPAISSDRSVQLPFA